ADLILTDIRMPIMDGLGLVRELKAHEDTCGVPVVAMTGFDTPEHRTAALQAGRVRHHAQPIDARGFPGPKREFLRPRGVGLPRNARRRFQRVAGKNGPAFVPWKAASPKRRHSHLFSAGVLPSSAAATLATPKNARPRSNHCA